LMLLFAVAMFVYTAINNDEMLKFNLVFILIIVIYSIVNFFIPSKKDHIRYLGGGLLLAALAWAFQPQYNILFTALYIIAAVLEKQAKFPLEIGVDKNGITINSFPKKKTAWNELNNVIIKDGIITVDHKNNKLFQKELDEEVTAETEKEFNDFCKLHLNN